MKRMSWYTWALLHVAAAALLLAAFVATGNNDFGRLAVIALLIGLFCGIVDVAVEP